MYVRLAFAVAAHLEPEILVVDEVLAVGDAQFQKKCLGQDERGGRGGRTVLFVSHNMNAVESLCTQALYLEQGQVAAQGHDVRAIVTQYLGGGDTESAPASVWLNTKDAVNHPVMQPLYFAIEDADGRPLMTPARNDEPLFVVIRADVRQLDPALCMGFALFNQDSHLLLWSLTTDGPEECWPRLAARRRPAALPAAETVSERRHLPARVELQPASAASGSRSPAEQSRGAVRDPGRPERLAVLAERATRHSRAGVEMGAGLQSVVGPRALDFRP